MNKDTSKIIFTGSVEDSVKMIIKKLAERGIIQPDSDNRFKAVTPVMKPKNWRQDADIQKARVLVSGGRGIGSPSFYDTLQKLAEILGGEVTSSRANVVAGWITQKRQVGSTGNIVFPEVYLACGISGTDQHKVGMKEANCIIAININPRAPIFKVANLGIVGDVKEIIPALISALT